MKRGEKKLFLSSNLKLLRERRNFSQERLAQELGLTRAKVAALEAGNTKSPPLTDLLDFSSYFKISIDTLLKVDLSKIGELKIRELEAGNDIYIKGGNLRVLAISVNSEERENVEYVPVEARAGYQAGYHDPQFIASLPKYSLPNLAPNGTYRLFPIIGDSMLPIVEGSDIIAQFVQDWTTLKRETPAIVILRGEQQFLFKMVTVEEGGELLLTSLNPAYPPYRVEGEEVLEVWRFYGYISREFPEPQSDLATVLQAIKAIKK